MEILFVLVFPIVLLLIGGTIGTVREQQHLRELTTREAAAAHVVLTDTKSLPPGMTGTAGALVTGSVVVASDYLKQSRAAFRALIGGEVRSYQTLMNRARREARLRMLEEAAALGTSLVINVRFTTSEVGASATEVICYGTAVRTHR